jgi:membrane associated rhomboid family serine protease
MPENLEKKRFFYSLIIPFLFVILVWVIKLLEHFDGLELYKLGILPRSIKGLLGIATTPFIHSDFAHLISNTMPLIVLGTGIIYFYRELAYRVILLIWIFGGAIVWILARDSYHIGASGLIYGIAAFLFFSGIFRKDNRLLAISLLVIFLYGSMVWGIFPMVPEISWESHLISGLCGLVLAQYYKKEGPPLPKQPFEEEPENQEDEIHSQECRESENKQNEQ